MSVVAIVRSIGSDRGERTPGLTTKRCLFATYRLRVRASLQHVRKWYEILIIDVTLLLVDDDRWLLESMADWLRSEGFRVHTASRIADAKRALNEHPVELVLCDIRLEDADGMELLRWAKRKHADTPMLMMTGYAGPEAGSEAIAAGAIDLLTKPLIDQELLMAIGRAIDQTRIAAENEQLKSQLDKRFGLENILSHDYRMTRIFDVIDSVADSKATVLITVKTEPVKA